MSDSKAAVANVAPAAQENAAGQAPPPNTTSLYVGDLHPDVTEKELFETFAKVAPVSSLRLCRDTASGASRGYGYVNFASQKDANAAVEALNHTVLNGKQIRVTWSSRDSELRKSGIGNLFVKNLPESIDSNKLQEIFTEFGKILSCKVVLSQEGKSRCYGYVQFETQESADAAVESLNQTLIDEKQIFVGKFIKKSERNSATPDPNYTNLYVKNLDQDITEELLRLKFSEFGKITSVVISRNPNGESKGFGFVNFETSPSAKAAVEALNGLQLGSKALYVARAQKKAERQQILGNLYGNNPESPKNAIPNMYIKNIADSVSEDDLKEYFSSCGNITSAKIMRGERGISRGFGFVCFSNSDEAKKAVDSLNGVMFHGKPLYVAIAQKKEERMRYLRNHYAHRVPQFHRPLPIPLQQQQNFIMPQQPPHIQQQPYVPIPQMNLNVLRNQWKGVGHRNGGMISVGGLPYSYYVPPVRSNGQQWSIRSDMAPYAAQKSQDTDPFGPLLASSSPEQQKQMIGDFLFPMIHNKKPDLAAKITGMLLEMDNRELFRILKSPNLVLAKADEAEKVIRNFKPGKDELDQATRVS